MKKAFSNENEGGLNIVVTGLLLHIKLNEAVGGEHVSCKNPDFDDCQIDYWKLTAKEIQSDILGEGTLIKESFTPDFDNSEDSALGETEPEDAIIDTDMDASSESTAVGQQEKPPVYTHPLIKPSDLQMVAEGTIPYGEGKEQPATASSTDNNNSVSRKEIEQLVKDFKRSCGDYHVSLKECNPEDTVVGPSVIRLKFRLGRGQSLQGLSSHLEDIGREMKRTGVIIQQVPNSDELLLDIPRLKREKVLFKDVIASLPKVTSPEQLYFPLGRTPNGKDLIEDLGQMPHMLVGGSTGSGKSVFLFTMLAAMLMTHPMMDVLYPHRELVCATSDGLPDELKNYLKSHPANDLQVLLKTKENADVLSKCAPFTKDYPIPEQGAMYYLCENGACKAPVSEFRMLKI